jgi:tetratricopeptide (TPR) repeat protein
MQTIIVDSRDKYLKLAFIIISALLLIIMPLISRDYGQSGDEWLQIEYGQHIWKYFFEGDKQALDYNNMSLQYQGIEFYGGLFDFSMELLHRALPSVPLLLLRHFFNAITGALLMIFTGLFTYRITGRRWLPALLALLFMIFSPRIFGESMNNPKDIPFACGFIIGMYYFLCLLQDLPARMLRNAIGVSIGFLIAFGVRPAGGLLLIANFIVMTGLYFFLNKEFKQTVSADKYKLFKKALVYVVPALLFGYIVGLLCWPWGLQAPLTGPLESLSQMTNIKITLRVFFEGVFRPNNAMPWYYELKWIMISNPVIVIIGVLIFILLIFRIKKELGLFPVALLLFAAFFTPFYMIYKKSSVHDTWRHLFFVYPYWVAMAAFGISLLDQFIKNQKLKWLPFAIAVLALTPAMAWTFRTHPNQYVYFNEFVGGIEGANGYYDTDYYQNSALQDAKWIRENVKPIPGRKIVVASNMLGFDKYFAKDTSWISWYYVRYNDRASKEWDYYVTYSRFISPEQLQNDKWPPQNVVHAVKVDGVTLSAVIQRRSNAGIAANEALQKQDFATAAQKYAEYIQTDASDENVFANYGIALASTGRMDEGIAAFNKAIELDPGRVDLYQTLAQIYKAKGDMQNAQQAMNTANSIIMREQELTEE